MAQQDTEEVWSRFLAVEDADCGVCHGSGTDRYGEDCGACGGLGVDWQRT